MCIDCNYNHIAFLLFVTTSKTRSSWFNCALRDDEAVCWVSIGYCEALAVGNWWYLVSRGHLCLYILHKVEIWKGVTHAWQTDWLTTLKDRATQLLIKFKTGALVTQLLFVKGGDTFLQKKRAFPILTTKEFSDLYFHNQTYRWILWLYIWLKCDTYFELEIVWKCLLVA